MAVEVDDVVVVVVEVVAVVVVVDVVDVVVDVVVVVSQTFVEFITVNVTQYSGDCTSSLIRKRKTISYN